LEKKLKIRVRALVLLFAVTIIGSVLFAGQTGKVSGYVTDETGNPVLGANVILEGTYYGAATDENGYYYIINVAPGKYTLKVSSIGYQTVKVTNVRINIDKTTRIDVKLREQSVSLGKEVVVTAKKPLITKDLTSTSATVSSEEIKQMPVEDMNQVVNLQAGVVDGHFRGGRSGEVAYLVDGIPVNDAYNGGMSVQVENNSIRQLEVISGTFNAEYGQAMSGIVNIVTQDAGLKYSGNVTAYGGMYYSRDTKIFRHLNTFGAGRSVDLQTTIGGPTKLIDNLGFFLSGRYVNDLGYFYGKRIYTINDSDPYNPHGDGAWVAMSPYIKTSLNGKLSYQGSNWKMSYNLFWDDNQNRYYDHSFSWAPDGRMYHYRTNIFHTFQFSYVPSQAMFTSLKFALNRNNYSGYLYANPYDPRYVNPKNGIPISNYTYRSGGDQGDRYFRHTYTYTTQYTFEYQANKEHKIKFGIDGNYYDLYDHWKTIVNLTEGQLDDNGHEIFTLGYRNLGTPGNQMYQKNPYSFAAYLQDKMEYDIMIINLGVRFDYFNSNTTMPVDLHNPSQVNPNTDFPGAGITKQVDAKYQISPRLGLSFPISDQGAIHFSYGHFFQIPNLQYLYMNSDYIINQGQSLSSVTGNPDLKAQKTVKYEIGLQQVVFPNVALNLTAYYSDIRDLLGTEIINTYEGFKYARFTNKDYGNVTGFILSLDKRYSDYFSAKIDYTFQIAEGNSSDPMSVYNNNQSNPPIEAEKKVVPLNWDQRSTLNLAVNVGVPSDWNVGFIARYGSGTPYTEDIQISNGVRFENGGRKPSTLYFDIKANKTFKVLGFDVNTFLLVYNLFDIRNETSVYATTGRATADLNTKYAGAIYGLNTIEDYINNPGMYSAPRQIKFGFSVNL
jgi:outer membrane receptor protein involved in Fe transport